MTTGLDDLIARAVAGELSQAEADSYCAVEGQGLDDLCNLMALEIARRFDTDRMPFGDADSALNMIYVLILEDAHRKGDGAILAEPAWSIYLAFDEGEYDHGDGADPVEKYTRPMIREVLREAP